MRGYSIRLCLRTFWVFWKGGRLWEVVALREVVTRGGSTVGHPEMN